MLRNKLHRTLLVVGITGSLIISTGLVAFASSGGHQGAVNGFMQKGGMQKGNPLVSVLKTQVTAGVITQAESDAITSFLKTKEAAEKTKLDAMTSSERQSYMKANKPVRENIIAELVAANLLTQDQASKIKASMPQRTEGGEKCGPGQGMKQGDPLATILKAQVTAKVITQAESDQVTAFLKTKEDAGKAEMTAEKSKLEAMTPADRQSYMKANRPAQENIFADLVTAGILTQNQADTIKAAMPQRHQMGNWNGQRPAGETTNK
jgi:F0F1-type ATP synthase delta subunit